MTQVKLISAWFGGVLLLAGVVGILESGAADVFLEATRPDFQKISLGVAGIQNAGGPDWLGGRIEEVLADLKRLVTPDLRLILDIFRLEPDEERYGAIAERNYRLAAESLAELYGE